LIRFDWSQALIR